GVNTIACSVTDNAGNGATATETVPLDTVPPATTASTDGLLGNGGWWRSAVDVELTATDATSGVDSTHFTLDTDPAAEGTSLTVEDDGLHTLAYASDDVAGNAEDEHSLAINIDSTPPRISIINPRQGVVYANDVDLPDAPEGPNTVIIGDKTVTADASDALSGVSEVEFYVDKVLRATASAAPYEFAWAAGEEIPGDHSLQAVAYDRAGNSASIAMTVTTVPTPLDIICRDIPPVIDTIRTPGLQIIGLLGDVIQLPDEVTRIVRSLGVVCEPPSNGPGGPGAPCGDVLVDQDGVKVAVTVTPYVDPNGIVHLTWCVWADATAAGHQNAGTAGRVDYIYTQVCQVPFSAWVFTDLPELVQVWKAYRVTC
ncbi:MAG: hypothetical protein LC624_04770, partial [Halobacteriales archaeon]|nr:hypothetical protein [Halobacteriales archaeon]